MLSLEMSHWWPHQGGPDEPSRPPESQPFNFYLESQTYKSGDAAERVRFRDLWPVLKLMYNHINNCNMNKLDHFTAKTVLFIICKTFFILR